MAGEKDFKTPEQLALEASGQNVPLGGQPVRPITTYEEMQTMTAAEHEVCDPIWDTVIKAFDKALEACPAVVPGTKGGRSRGAMEIRNYVAVWKSQAEHLKAGL